MLFLSEKHKNGSSYQCYDRQCLLRVSKPTPIMNTVQGKDAIAQFSAKCIEYLTPPDSKHLHKAGRGHICLLNKIMSVRKFQV